MATETPVTVIKEVKAQAMSFEDLTANLEAATASEFPFELTLNKDVKPFGYCRDLSDAQVSGSSLYMTNGPLLVCQNNIVSISARDWKTMIAPFNVKSKAPTVNIRRAVKIAVRYLLYGQATAIQMTLTQRVRDNKSTNCDYTLSLAEDGLLLCNKTGQDVQHIAGRPNILLAKLLEWCDEPRPAKQCWC
jgi:hypothetical protein